MSRRRPEQGAGGRQGYNLLEVTLAAFLFAVIVVFSVTVWGSHARAIGKARYDMLGNFLASQKLEECIARGYSGVDIMSTPPAGMQVDLTTTVRGRESSTTYTYFILIQTVPGRAKLKSVCVLVRWQGLTGPREVRLETLLAGR
ncbi:MAG: hypothetical protein AB1758_36250 [Candidatus Eremiobacterota bacterium]